MEKFIEDLKTCLERFGDIKLSQLLYTLTGVIEIDIKEVNNYYKFTLNDSFRLINVKKIVNEHKKEAILVYDELKVIGYQKISFTTDCEGIRSILFDEPYEVITEKEWIKELCYYFKRVPGNEEICCP